MTSPRKRHLPSPTSFPHLHPYISSSHLPPVDLHPCHTCPSFDPPTARISLLARLVMGSPKHPLPHAMATPSRLHHHLRRLVDEVFPRSASLVDISLAAGLFEFPPRSANRSASFARSLYPVALFPSPVPLCASCSPPYAFCYPLGSSSSSSPPQRRRTRLLSSRILHPLSPPVCTLFVSRLCVHPVRPRYHLPALPSVVPLSDETYRVLISL